MVLRLPFLRICSHVFQSCIFSSRVSVAPLLSINVRTVACVFVMLQTRTRASVAVTAVNPRDWGLGVCTLEDLATRPPLARWSFGRSRRPPDADDVRLFVFTEAAGASSSKRADRTHANDRPTAACCSVQRLQSDLRDINVLSYSFHCSTFPANCLTVASWRHRSSPRDCRPRKGVKAEWQQRWESEFYHVRRPRPHRGCKNCCCCCCWCCCITTLRLPHKVRRFRCQQPAAVHTVF